MTISEHHKKFIDSLTELYGDREAATITDWIFESSAGLKRTDRTLKKNESLDPSVALKLSRQLKELLQNKPVQYVLGEVYFYRMKFKVNKHVLIPRPETEELIEWVCNYVKEKKIKNPAIIDIGTGSGCIPISIKKNIPSSTIAAIDVSPNAVRLAKENAGLLNTEVTFKVIDFLEELQWRKLGKYDIIVSNPPYIPITEKDSLNKNVTDFEPHVALFVPDEDPVLFYRKIEKFAAEHLNAGGSIFVEIHESYAGPVVNLFEKIKWEITVRKDIYGRDRMVMAKLN